MGLTPYAVALCACVLFGLVLVGLATCVALFVGDSGRRSDAIRVLRILICSTGGSGIVAALLQLHDAGLL
ncbi:hypothetical protein AB0F43_31015 [Kribbella sp. NPDC023972]|uniref:hypothetical protein n=1 Tax=Kribbella sp. NPDC023972 TaxID=3154795 RepID=UPI00340732A0